MLRTTLVTLAVITLSLSLNAQNSKQKALQKKTAKEATTGVMYSQNISLKQVYEMPCADQVPLHLDWCSTDHGYNEGAECGLKALTGSGVPLPADVGQQVLGNIWDRTNMMGATKTAWKVGAKDAAVAAATCCQIHNPPAHQCVSSRPDLVKKWLDSHP
jgi:hypothetical protein